MDKPLIIIYNPDGEYARHPPDGKCMDEAKKIIREYLTNRKEESDDTTYAVGSELLIDCLRILIMGGTIDHNQIQFKYFNTNLDQWELILCDKNGRLDRWPKGFCDYRDNLLDELLENEV